MNNARHLSLLTSLALITFVRSFAALTPIGPFVGELSESFESFENYNVDADHRLDPVTQIMGGAATISYNIAQIYEPSAGAGFGLNENVPAEVADGTKGLAYSFANSNNGYFVITFNQPVYEFGGYFGFYTASGGGGTINGESIWMTNLFPNSGTLEWHGWRSDVAIQRIELSGIYNTMDALQANTVPDSGATVGLLGLALLSLAALKRKTPDRV